MATSSTSPTARTREPARGSDLARQITVTACFVFCIVGSMVGVGVFGGTPVAESAGGALSADATYLAPASPAFSIWSVIYTGLGLYTLYQWLPRQRTSPRQRSLGWLVAASLVLNAAWILSVQADSVPLSVAVIVLLLVVLAWLFVRYTACRPDSRVEAVVVDGTLGLYLGWVSVATAANTASLLTSQGFRGFGLPAEAWSIAVLAAIVLVAVGLAAYGRGRLAPALAIGWGLSWIAVSRVNGGLENTATAVAAAVAAVLVLLGTAAFRLRSRRGTDSRPAGAARPQTAG